MTVLTQQEVEDRIENSESLENCFIGDVDFTDKIFRGNANFTNAVFEGNAYFANTVFCGGVDFTGAIFEGDYDFSDTAHCIPFEIVIKDNKAI